MYTDIKSVVKWEGKVSRPLAEWLCTKQGGSYVTGNYQTGKNNILAQQDKNHRLHIGHMNVEVIMAADDLVVTAHTGR